MPDDKTSECRRLLLCRGYWGGRLRYTSIHEPTLVMGSGEEVVAASGTMEVPGDQLVFQRDDALSWMEAGSVGEARPAEPAGARTAPDDELLSCPGSCCSDPVLQWWWRQLVPCLSCRIP
jgi:hypothetical protein